MSLRQVFTDRGSYILFVSTHTKIGIKVFEIDFVIEI